MAHAQRIIDLYTIDSHPNPERALQWMRENMHDLYSWHDDNAESLKAFAAVFDCTTPEWEVSTCSYSYARLTARDYDLDDMQGARLWKFIQARYITPGMLDGDCPFTGYCMDEALLDPIRAFIARPSATVTMQSLLDDCAAAWVQAYVEDWQAAYEDDALREMAEANEWFFDESGALC